MASRPVLSRGHDPSSSPTLSAASSNQSAAHNRRGRHVWTEFELRTILSIICRRGSPAVSRGDVLGFATALNTALNGKGSSDKDVPVEAVRHLLGRLERDKRGALSFLERSSYRRLTRIAMRVFSRDGVDFDGSLREWKIEGRKQRVLGKKPEEIRKQKAIEDGNLDFDGSDEDTRELSQVAIPSTETAGPQSHLVDDGNPEDQTVDLGKTSEFTDLMLMDDAVEVETAVPHEDQSQEVSPFVQPNYYGTTSLTDSQPLQYVVPLPSMEAPLPPLEQYNVPQGNMGGSTALGLHVESHTDSVLQPSFSESDATGGCTSYGEPLSRAWESMPGAAETAWHVNEPMQPHLDWSHNHNAVEETWPTSHQAADIGEMGYLMPSGNEIAPQFYVSAPGPFVTPSDLENRARTAESDFLPSNADDHYQEAFQMQQSSYIEANNRVKYGQSSPQIHPDRRAVLQERQDALDDVQDPWTNAGRST